jgi:glycosyltransferase involved in cell wall biosynthesis
MVLLSVFCFVFALKLYFTIFFTGGLLLKINNKTQQKNLNSDISLLMTVRNEEENLQKNLDKILSIDKLNYELVVVDDFSEDNSLSVLGTKAKKYKHLKISGLSQETRYSVKFAQNIALKAAKYEWVILIPAGIKEFSVNWLKSITSHVTDEVDVIIGYSNIQKEVGVVNRLYRAENFLQQIKSFEFINRGFSFIYNEENVAFRKKKYFELGGYGRKVGEFYANLELIINQFISGKKTEFSIHEDTSIKKSESVSTQHFFDLIRKEFSIEKQLSSLKKLILFINRTVNFLISILSLLVILFISGSWILVIASLLVLFFLHAFIIKNILNHLKEHNLFLTSLVYGNLVQIFKPFYRIYYRYKLRKRRELWKSKN